MPWYFSFVNRKPKNRNSVGFSVGFETELCRFGFLVFSPVPYTNNAYVCKETRMFEQPQATAAHSTQQSSTAPLYNVCTWESYWLGLVPPHLYRI